MSRVIDIKQNTNEWHEFRKLHIGASDGPIIMGVSPWTKPSELYAQKIGKADPPVITSRMKRGNEIEPKIRDYVNRQMHSYVPMIFEMDNHLSFISASCDGYDEHDDTILEIKAPNEKTHDMNAHGGIPIYYWIQIQHQLMVTGAKWCLYCTYNGGEYNITNIMPASDFWPWMVVCYQTFWKKVVSNT